MKTAQKPILAIEDVHFFRGTTLILQDVHWSLGQAEIGAILGPNGCGKSTLLRLISGYLWASSGAITLLGKRFGEFPIAKLRERISVIEATTVYPFSEAMNALDVVCSGYFSTLTLDYRQPATRQWAAAQKALNEVGLADRARQLYTTLSTGQRMRVLIARALVKKPELLLLDEPTAGLDLPARESVLATVARLRRLKKPPAVVMITHHLEELLPETTNVLLLGINGIVVASGTPEKVLTHKNLSAAYDWPMRVIRRNGRYLAHASPQSWDHLI